MSREYRQFAVTTPVATPEATPQRTVLDMPPRVITSVRIRIPPGPRGELGFALANAGNPVIPADAGQWIITDDETFVFTPEGATTSGTWDLLTYNTGSYPHTVYLTFGCTLPGEPTPAATPGPLATGTIGGAVTVTRPTAAPTVPTAAPTVPPVTPTATPTSVPTTTAVTVPTTPTATPPPVTTVTPTTSPATTSPPAAATPLPATAFPPATPATPTVPAVTAPVTPPAITTTTPPPATTPTPQTPRPIPPGIEKTKPPPQTEPRPPTPTPPPIPPTRIPLGERGTTRNNREF